MSLVVRLLVVLCVTLLLVGRGIAQAPADPEQVRERVRLSLERGAYGDAERDAKQLTAMVAAQDGQDALELARASDLLVEALVRNGQAGALSTLTLAEQVVRLKELRLGPEHLETASSLLNLANVHVERGEFSAALPSHERELSIRSRQLQPNASAIADSLDSLAVTLMQMERFEDAKRTLARAQAIRELRPDSEPLALSHTLELVAWLNRYSGDYTAAQPALDRALSIRQRLSPDHPDMASTIEVRGDLLWLKGEIEAARNVWADGLALIERTLGPGAPGYCCVSAKTRPCSGCSGSSAFDGRSRLQGCAPSS